MSPITVQHPASQLVEERVERHLLCLTIGVVITFLAATKVVGMGEAIVISNYARTRDPVGDSASHYFEDAGGLSRGTTPLLIELLMVATSERTRTCLCL